MFQAEKCDLCGDCLALCPYFDFSREEAINEFKRLMEGEPAEIIRECVTCVACNRFCERRANPFDLILQRQEETGALNIPEQNSQVFRNLPLVPSEIVRGEAGKRTLSLCSVGEFIPGLFDGPIFEGMTVLKGGDYFCGVGWVHLGNGSALREIAPRVIANLAVTGAEEIVFYHDDCFALMKTMAPEFGIEVPFRPVHVIEHMLEYVSDHRSQVQPLGMRVAYQQPCASRYTPEKDEMLDRLFELIGVERVARKYDRTGALCCGSALMPRDRERAAKVKSMNVGDAVDSGAEALVYLCPLCVLNLRKPAAAAGLDNFHVIELVNRAFA